MSDDPYKALGLTPSATAEDIKKAYRKLVRTSHPDLHPDDPAAEARFKAISAAHDLLKDPETRAKFDAGEIDASGQQKPERRYYRDFADAPGGNAYQQQRGFESGVDPEDFFAEILRRRGRTGGRQPGFGDPFGDSNFSAPGQDLRYSLEVPFLDAARGARTRITLPDGSGLEVTIPPGLSDGQTLRLRGKGGPGFGGGPVGDALITVAVRGHPVFRRDGNDIHIDLPITIDEAVLGSKIAVPTIAGNVNVTIPKGSNTGRSLRLRGRGVKPTKGEPGDQIVALRVEMPSVIDPALAAFMEEWRKTNTYDPRQDLFEVVPE
jgi:DnaJ-class molecular chaperone